MHHELHDQDYEHLEIIFRMGLGSSPGPGLSEGQDRDHGSTAPTEVVGLGWIPGPFSRYFKDVHNVDHEVYHEFDHDFDADFDHEGLK